MRYALMAGLGLLAATQASALVTTSSRNATSPVPSSGLMSTYAGVTTLTFDGVTPGQQPAGFTPASGSVPGGGVVSASNSSLYAAPLGDTTNFYAVALNPTSLPTVPATDTFTPGGSYNYFGLYWGSIDTFNTITFLNGTTQVAQFTGGSFLPASGSQTSATTNQYVDFLFTGTDRYTSVRFDTTNRNFELDNVAYGNVPEPMSWAMMVAGFGFVGSALRRKRASVAFA